jgi:nitrogen fixation NifU-like protein
MNRSSEVGNVGPSINDVSQIDEIDMQMYQENVVDHYKNPHNKWEMSDFTIKHKETNPLCGDEITMFLKIVDGKIVDVSFVGDGCAISQASISMFSDKLKGMSVDDARALGEKDIFDLLNIPISHTRIKCAMLSLKVLKKSLDE